MLGFLGPHSTTSYRADALDERCLRNACLKTHGMPSRRFEIRTQTQKCNHTMQSISRLHFFIQKNPAAWGNRSVIIFSFAIAVFLFDLFHWKTRYRGPNSRAIQVCVHQPSIHPRPTSLESFAHASQYPWHRNVGLWLWRRSVLTCHVGKFGTSPRVWGCNLFCILKKVYFFNTLQSSVNKIFPFVLGPSITLVLQGTTLWNYHWMNRRAVARWYFPSPEMVHSILLVEKISHHFIHRSIEVDIFSCENLSIRSSTRPWWVRWASARRSPKIQGN